MAGLKDYQISVYVANLGKYVEGVLQGAWIGLAERYRRPVLARGDRRGGRMAG